MYFPTSILVAAFILNISLTTSHSISHKLPNHLNRREKRDVIISDNYQCPFEYEIINTQMPVCSSRSGFGLEDQSAFIQTRLQSNGEVDDIIVPIRTAGAASRKYYNPWYEQTAPTVYKTNDKYYLPKTKYHNPNEYYLEDSAKYVMNPTKEQHYPGLVYMSADDLLDNWDVAEDDDVFFKIDDTPEAVVSASNTVIDGQGRIVEDAPRIYNAGVVENSELTAEFRDIVDKVFEESEFDVASDEEHDDAILVDKVATGVTKTTYPFFGDGLNEDDVPVLLDAISVENSELTAETHAIERAEIVEKEKGTSTQDDVVLTEEVLTEEENNGTLVVKNTGSVNNDKVVEEGYIEEILTQDNNSTSVGNNPESMKEKHKINNTTVDNCTENINSTAKPTHVLNINTDMYAKEKKPTHTINITETIINSSDVLPKILPRSKQHIQTIPHRIVKSVEPKAVESLLKNEWSELNPPNR